MTIGNIPCPSSTLHLILLQATDALELPQMGNFSYCLPIWLPDKHMQRQPQQRQINTCHCRQV